MGLRFSTIAKYKGMFQNCTMEPIIHGFGLFDKNKKFVGYILDSGFAVNMKHEHHAEIIRQCTQNGINVFDVETYEEIEQEQQIEEALYGNPK